MTFNTCPYVIPLGPPVLRDIPQITVKRGENAIAICSTVSSSGTDVDITWQTTGSVVVSEGVTQLNNTASRLIVESVTQVVEYLCMANNSIGRAFEVVRIDIIDVPSQPRNLKKGPFKTGNMVTISWEAPVTDNGQPLTAYYITIQEMASVPLVTKVSTDRYSLSTTKCGNLTVMVVAENDCGNSTAVTLAFEADCQTSKLETYNCNHCQCLIPIASEEESSNTLPVIAAGVVIVIVFVVITITVIVVFICWYNRQRKQLETKSSVYGIEAPVRNFIIKCNVCLLCSMNSLWIMVK